MSKPPFRWNLRGRAYRLVMRVAHRFNWHYAPPTHGIMPGNDTQLWCQWCGMRYTVPKRTVPISPSSERG